MVQLKAQGDSCRRYIVEGVALNVPYATDIILGFVSRVYQGVIIVDSRSIFEGSTRCYYKVEKLSPQGSGVQSGVQGTSQFLGASSSNRPQTNTTSRRGSQQRG
ncbi:unnamed protein product [Prunus armeniaca]